MPKQFSLNLMVLFYTLDVTLTEAMLYLAGLARHHIPIGDHFPLNEALPPLGAYVMVAVIWSVCFLLLSVYDADHVLRAVDEFQAVTGAVVLATFVFAGGIYLAHYLIPRLLFLYFAIGDLTLLLSYRALVRLFYRVRDWIRPRYATRVLIIGAGSLGSEVAQALDEYRWAGLHIEGYLDDDPDKQGRRIADFPVLDSLDRVGDIVQKRDVDEVIITLPMKAHRRMKDLIAELWELPVRVKVVPDYSALVFSRATFERLGEVPLIGLREPAIDGLQRFIKRLFDWAVSSALIILLSPLMALIALLVKLSSAGPILFKQERMGENGRLFLMYKFRTMVPDAEEHLDEVIETTSEGDILYKTEDDPRITPVGRVLRRYSLDELPQLFNVWMGDMSLVGPRPELPWLVERYAPWQRQRFSVPQGMTGWWQVNGRSDKPMHLHTEDDLYYIQNYSLWLDLRILWRTVSVVFKGKGAF